ncbi:MAG: hypothetical protein DMG65_14300 [Candidatus Angelobacter sp. Gp1-AA117]|nr:MAG: hypothetical protein DMG65_14300 [Candidatus Angelobacter sp. Gp1-AA117]
MFFIYFIQAGCIGTSIANVAPPGRFVQGHCCYFIASAIELQNGQRERFGPATTVPNHILNLVVLCGILLFVSDYIERVMSGSLKAIELYLKLVTLTATFFSTAQVLFITFSQCRMAKPVIHISEIEGTSAVLLRSWRK